MRMTVMRWGAGGIAALLAVIACSGTRLHEVGELNHDGSGGTAGSSTLGPSVAGLAENGGSRDIGPGGAPGGGSAPFDDSAGAAGEPDRVLECPGCVVVATGQDVRGIAADDQHVFWVDYGTRDELGNHEGNGRLLARNLASGATSVLAASLPGPESVALSSQYAYLFVDQQTSRDQPFGVLRVPLAGGAVQTVQGYVSAEATTFQVFASNSGYEYWNWGGAVYRVAHGDNAVAETFVEPQGVLHVFADETQVYFQDLTGLWTVPLTGGAPSKLSTVAASVYDVQLLNGDYLYALEFGTKAYLARLPKTGGAWKRIVETQTTWSGLSVDGDRFFSDKATTGQRRIVQSSFLNPTTETVLAAESHGRNEYWTWKAWTLSSVGIFLADANGLYLTPTVSP